MICNNNVSINEWIHKSKCYNGIISKSQQYPHLLDESTTKTEIHITGNDKWLNNEYS